MLEYGLDVLQGHMEALVDLDLRLCLKCTCLLSNREVEEGTYLYTGWCLSPLPAEILEELPRAYLEYLIMRKVAQQDDMVGSVRKWKREVEDRIWRDWNLKRQETRR